MYEVDIYNRQVTAVDPAAELKPMVEIHMSALILKHAMAAKFCAQIAIGKRVKYKVTTRTRQHVLLLEFLMNLYESELLPVRKWFRYRFLETWVLRWREIMLYLRIMLDRMRSRRLSEEEYILSTHV